MIDISQAVMSLRPNTEWSMNGDDVEGIIWHTEGVQPLTRAEVDVEVARLESAVVAEQQRKEAARASAITKLAVFGLDESEVLALMGQ